MSKWVNTDMFNRFAAEKEKEQEQQQASKSGMDFSKRWSIGQNDKGTPDVPTEFILRFLQDPTGLFYVPVHYHMFQSGEKWIFVCCPKTFDFSAFCPWCALNSKLYSGNENDKKQAYRYKRKTKFFGNAFIINDFRDAKIKEEEKRATGKVKIYEFADKIEKKIKLEITDKKNGLGNAILDPGADGYSFIIKVRSTKPAADGKSWADYSDSVFARKPEALGSEGEIEKIMASRFILNAETKAIETSKEEHIRLIQAELMYDYVESDVQKFWNIGNKPTENTQKNEVKQEEKPVREEMKKMDDTIFPEKTNDQTPPWENASTKAEEKKSVTNVQPEVKGETEQDLLDFLKELK